MLFYTLTINKQKDEYSDIKLCEIGESQCPDNYYTCLDDPDVSKRGCSEQPWNNEICKSQCIKSSKKPQPEDIKLCEIGESQCPDNYYTCLDDPDVSKRGCSEQPWNNEICKSQCIKSSKKPQPDEKVLKIIIHNKLNIESYIFLRGIITNLYIDKQLQKNIVNNKKYDCTGKIPNIELSDNQKIESCVSYPKTFYFQLKPSQNIILYLGNADTIISGAIWAVPITATNINSGGPFKQSQAEFTIDNNVVSYDLTFVEAVSHGLKMVYTSADNTKTDINCNPTQPTNYNKNLYIDKSLGFPTILSDKWTASNTKSFSSEYTDQELAQCPAILSDNVRGQHECRKFYANSYNDKNSYCSWLKDNNCQGYCWAMDEWECSDLSCGWGGENQPTNEDDIYNTGLQKGYDIDFINKNANIYSCGKWDPPNYDERLLGFWKNAPGCKEKMVKGQPTNPQPKRNGGKFEIFLTKLDWLK
jgi:hypothetical protein